METETNSKQSMQKAVKRWPFSLANIDAGTFFNFSAAFPKNCWR
jgi:hypothetical protein